MPADDKEGAARFPKRITLTGSSKGPNRRWRFQWVYSVSNEHELEVVWATSTWAYCTLTARGMVGTQDHPVPF